MDHQLEPSTFITTRGDPKVRLQSGKIIYPMYNVYFDSFACHFSSWKCDSPRWLCLFVPIFFFGFSSSPFFLRERERERDFFVCPSSHHERGVVKSFALVVLKRKWIELSPEIASRFELPSLFSLCFSPSLSLSLSLSLSQAMCLFPRLFLDPSWIINVKSNSKDWINDWTKVSCESHALCLWPFSPFSPSFSLSLSLRLSVCPVFWKENRILHLTVDFISQLYFCQMPAFSPRDSRHILCLHHLCISFGSIRLTFFKFSLSLFSYSLCLLVKVGVSLMEVCLDTLKSRPLEIN